jgi:hypothetical protein
MLSEAVLSKYFTSFGFHFDVELEEFGADDYLPTAMRIICLESLNAM